MHRKGSHLSTLTFARPEDAQQHADGTIAELRRQLLMFLAGGESRSLREVFEHLVPIAVELSGDDAGRLMGKAVLEAILHDGVDMDADQNLALSAQ